MTREPADFVAAFRLGACGYVLKETAPDRLGHVLRAVLAGETAVPRSLVRLVIDEMRIRRSPNRLRLANERAVRLTDREWEVLELLREGCTTAEVAERLLVSQVTVRTHISGLQKKLQVKDRAAAIKLLEEVEARDEPDM